jgi:hypothetical protein
MPTVPDLTNEQLTLALAIVAGVALIAFVVAAVSMAKLRKARKEYVILRGESGPRDLLAAVSHAMRQVESISTRVDGVVTRQEEQAAIGRFALQRFGMVRYDAFEDMGGRLSFSAAILDDHGDGLVMTSINGRTETRTYAKPVTRLSSEHNLSGEERAAIDMAAAGNEGSSKQRRAATSN